MIPSEQFALNLLLQLVDTDGKLASDSPLPPMEPLQPNPDPDTAFIPLMAELHPEYPTVIEPVSDGKKKGFA
jgi:hypothetical protein